MQIKIGTIGKQQLVVTIELTAARYGSGLIEVFATPAMIALMEKTCQESVQDQLDAGHLTVGTLVNVKHLKATPVGMSVECESELIAWEGRKLTFKVVAKDEQGIIGEGLHERFIINEADFMSKLVSK
ncbi:MAG TPA: thioesterase family protein [Lentimicrobium sp.]|nr:thioesterase family protein [Lentimicrobium sp.]